MILTTSELIRIREQNGLSRKAMAKRMGIAQAAYAEVERGNRPIPKRWIDGTIWLLRNYTDVENMN